MHQKVAIFVLRCPLSCVSEGIVESSSLYHKSFLSNIY